MDRDDLRTAIEGSINSASVRGGSNAEAVEEILEAVDEYVAARQTGMTTATCENRQD